PAMFTFTAGLVLAMAVAPKIHKFKVPGSRLAAKTQPRLFALIADVAQATGQRMPAEVYVDGKVNAWVTERGGFLGLGKRRVLCLGLPLMATLTKTQLKAVIAHEFGHYYGGDTRLGPWIYKTHRSMLDVAVGLSQTGYGAWLNIVMIPYVEIL